MPILNPKVSIVIPVYNGSNYLKEAIDSALAQTYNHIEIIVVNDGSTDNGATEKIAKSYGDKIRYFAKENGGVATALNLGIEKMTGEYFSWLSHDDLYYPEKIEKQIKYLDKLKNKNVVLYSNYEVIDEDSFNVSFVSHDHNMLSIKPEYALLRGCVNGITLLIPKKAFDDYGGFDAKLRCTQDYDMWRRIIHKYQFVHMQEFLAKTREHSLQDSNGHPRAIVEGDELWIDMMEDLDASTKVRLEGSEYAYYLNIFFHLKNSPYTKAAAFANNKTEVIYKKLSAKNTNKNPLVSVIIPCYNQGNFIDEAVSSVLNQTYSNYEIIIINDGSTDKKTNELLKNYKRPKTTVYETENQGVTLTRNYGVSLARGSLIQFLDADDYINPDKFEYQVRLFTASPSTSVCYTKYRYYFEKDNEYQPPFHSMVLSNNPFDDFVYRWQRSLSIPMHSAMFKKDIFNNSIPFVPGMKGSEDWVMWVDISSRGAQFVLLNEDMATYRVQEKSITTNGEHMFYWACRAVSYIADHYIEKKDNEQYDKSQQAYLKYLADYLLFDDKMSERTDSLSRQVVVRVKKSLPYKAARVLYKRGPKVALKTVKSKMGGKR